MLKLDPTQRITAEEALEHVKLINFFNWKINKFFFIAIFCRIITMKNRFQISNKLY